MNDARTYLVDGRRLTADECRALFSATALGDRQRRVLQQIEGDTIVDVGCYTGQFVGEAARRFPAKTIIGVDYFDDNIDIAHLLYPEMRDRFRLMSAYRLDFADASLDCVTLQEVIEHLEGAAQAIKEANRVLKPGGALIVSVPNPFYWRHMAGFLRFELCNRLRRPKALGTEIFYENVEWNRHVHAWTPQTLLTLLSVNGFVYVDHVYENGMPRRLERWFLSAFPFLGPTQIVKVRKIAAASPVLV
jgi:ubiquinone/menaquinone biosynthesis C-methylase UbiE